jgi:dephospho-CoA kinase
MVTAGLTGGIASGKTMVARLFGQLGAELIDADVVARQVVEPGTEGLERVKACFGPGVLSRDGRLDRDQLGAVVFSDAVQLHTLNALLHPLIADQIHAKIAGLRGARFSGVVIVDVPLLFECGWHPMFDRSIVVYCEPGVQRERLMARSGLDAAQADARIASQMPLQEKKRAADFVIDNQGTPKSLYPQVASLYGQLLELARLQG